MNRLLSIALFVALISACGETKNKFYSANDPSIRYAGRIDFENPEEPVLISSASYVEFAFFGDSCSVMLKQLRGSGQYNYVSIEIDNEYIDRIKLIGDAFKPYGFNVEGEESHIMRIYKATEASTGGLSFGGAYAKSITALPDLPIRKIEFIGNSITCAAQADLEDVPCGTGEYHDRHNAYWSYATQSAKQLNAQYLLSSVSGIGIYRNWNSLYPVMPDVYENLYLNTDSTRRYDFTKYVPDMVSICLGTNDMSYGDRIKERLPFDSAIFVQEYVDFIGTVYTKYPDTQICLLTSPLVYEPERSQLVSCLSAVVQNSNEVYADKTPVVLFDIFVDAPAGGCGHPSVTDHIGIAERVIPFYKDVMNW